MLLAVVYGVYVWFLPSPQQAAANKDENEQKRLNAFILKVAEQTATGLPKNMAYVLQKAEAKWKGDPLIQIEPKTIAEKEDSPKPVISPKVKYTGFLRMGDRRLAIIDGMEYEAGDRLEPSGFIIRSISPSHVVIAHPGRKKKTIKLPLEETQ